MLDDEITLSDPFLELQERLHPYTGGIFNELDSPRYINRTHYSRATYMAGCRGPLCKTAASDWHKFRKAGGGGIVFPKIEILEDTPGRENYLKYGFLIGLMRVQMRVIPDHLWYAASQYNVPILEIPSRASRPLETIVRALKETLQVIDLAPEKN